MARRPKVATIPELVDKVRESQARWRTVKRKGTADPFHPDGTNLSLIRNHIAYYQGQLRDRCRAERVRPCPREARQKLPPVVSGDYMAPGSKAARHAWPPVKRRKRRRTKAR